MWYSARQKANAEINDFTPENRAVVAGGTQGIGGGIALRFALAGASVWIVGRSTQRGESMVEKLHAATQEGQRRRRQNEKAAASSSSSTIGNVRADHAFLQADLTNIAEVKRLANDISKRAGKQGVDWLFECQGGPPTGNDTDTPQGIDTHFAVQCLSRYALAKQLLAAGTIKRGVCMVAAPGNGSKKPLDLDDIETKKGRSRFGLNILNSGQRDSSVLDAACQSLAEKYPNIMISHLFPGVVGTKAAGNKGFPFPLPQLSALGALVFPSPEQYAEVPFFLHAHPDGQRYLRSGEANLFGCTLKRCDMSPNVATKEARAAVIQKLDAYGA